MKKKNNYPKNVKLRITDQQDTYITQVALENNVSKTTVIREALFGEAAASSYAVKIYKNMVKNELCNKINASHKNKFTKEEIIRMVIDID